MDYMGTKAAAELWNMTQNLVSRLCREGKIPGAEQDKKGSPWRIPVDTLKPEMKERRKKQ